MKKHLKEFYTDKMEMKFTENKISDIFSQKYNKDMIIILHKIIDIQASQKFSVCIIIFVTLTLSVPQETEMILDILYSSLIFTFLNL